MCIIIDANQAHLFSNPSEAPYIAAVIKWINSGGKVVSGGKLEMELAKLSRMRGLLMEWNRSGRIVRIANDKIDAEERAVAGQCRSNDSHVVALARSSDADLVLTEDGNLIDDLKNNGLVFHRRRIYKARAGSKDYTRHHADMLKRANCR